MKMKRIKIELSWQQQAGWAVLSTTLLLLLTVSLTLCHWADQFIFLTAGGATILICAVVAWVANDAPTIFGLTITAGLVLIYVALTASLHGIREMPLVIKAATFLAPAICLLISWETAWIRNKIIWRPKRVRQRIKQN
jgi:hypothetical protein